MFYNDHQIAEICDYLGHLVEKEIINYPVSSLAIIEAQFQGSTERKTSLSSSFKNVPLEVIAGILF